MYWPELPALTIDLHEVGHLIGGDVEIGLQLQAALLRARR
jgi:hypothetical protein